MTTTSQTLQLHELSNRLARLEQEVTAIRGEMAKVLQSPVTPQPALTFAWTDKEMLRRWSANLFAALNIQAVPMGAPQLQQRMAQANLSANELSRSLVEAREARSKQGYGP